MQNVARLQKASERVVVLLKPSEKRRLEKLAKAEQVSSAEILRRSLSAYNNADEALTREAVTEMNALLDGMLETLRNTREQVRRNLDSVRQRREQV